VPNSGYVHLGTIVGSMRADRTDVGARGIPLLHSDLTQTGEYLKVAFGRGAQERLPRPTPIREPPIGTVPSARDDLPGSECGGRAPRS
jgi:hypothetical protein